ncbi:MAG: hypothetical protein HQ582_10270 [Planctomycetes bacterium]|nr:hypothetical protein [Planctomycetota bacterium]
MYKRYVFILLMFTAGLIAVASELEGRIERQIPIVVSAEVKPRIVKSGEVIPLTITVSNGLSSSIDHLTFSLTPNDWNGETFNVSLVDIYRDDEVGNLYLARPEMNVPMTISGMGRKEIKPGDKLDIRTDVRKWKLRDGWFPGKYKVTVRVGNLMVDKYSTLSVLSDPIEFEIK